MDVSLTDAQERYVAEQLASGRYRSVTELVRDGVRLLMEREDDERRRDAAWRDEVRRKIELGFEEARRGETKDGEAVFDELRRTLEQRAKRDAG